MPLRLRILVVSDIHHAGPRERLRHNFEALSIPSKLLRFLAMSYRRWIWLHNPLAHYWRLDQFLERAGAADFVVANGDFSCDSAFVGTADDATFESVQNCMKRLRECYPGRFAATIGDHELGKLSLGGDAGGMHLASWKRAVDELGMRPFWTAELGNYVLCGVTSSLIALPVLEVETLPSEREEWRALRENHFSQIRAFFASLRPEQRVLLFTHDPTALPFLWQDDVIRAKLGQVENTIIGHLHTNAIFRLSRLMAGMPVIRFLGNTPRRLSSALREARCWKAFKVKLCPALAGTELLKDGGYYSVELDPAAIEPARFKFHPLPWKRDAA